MVRSQRFAAHSRVPALISALAFAIGFFNIASNTFRKFRGPSGAVERYVSVFLNSTAFATALFTGLVLILLSKALRRRKRRAWRVAVIMLLLNLASELFRFHFHPTQVFFSAFLLLVLFFFRDEFYAVSDPTTKFRPLYIFIFSFIFFLIIGILFFYLRHSADVIGNPTFSEVALTVLSGFVWISGPISLSSKIAQDTMELVLGLFGFLIFLMPLGAFFRRVKSLPVSSEEEKTRIVQLVEKFGDSDSLAFFATREDKSTVWSENLKAGIAYRVENGVMLASGDPFGEYSIWADAISAFLKKAEEHGWTPAVMGASERGGKLWIEHAGLSAIEIGDEAIVHVDEYSLEGHAMSNVRQTINRARRQGYVCEVKEVSELTQEQRKEISQKAQNWRGGASERGFSMSMDRFLGELDSKAVLTLGYLDSQLVSFLYFVPWGKVGLSLDRMQRDPHISQGITELLIDTAVEYASERKIRYISLNFAAFRSVLERAEKINAGPVLRSIRWLVQFSSGWFQVESLYRFNAKFHPEWQPRYLLHPGIGELSSVIWAALKAEKFISGFGRRKVK